MVTAPSPAMPRKRTNAEWISELSAGGELREAALTDLRRILVKGLHHSIGPTCAGAFLIEDFVQEALIRIFATIASFRGESRFETWAMSIAVRVAVSEMRRARWKDVSLDQMVEAGRLFPETKSADHESNQLMGVVTAAIQKGLTTKQRDAILAELGGAPPDEVAQRLGTNRNALYKLVYDARARIKQAILDAGWTEAHVRLILEGK